MSERPNRPNLRKAKITDRIEIRCTPEEKDLIYIAALAANKTASRYMVDLAIKQAKKDGHGHD